MEKRRIVAFDFDDTLTTKDTLFQFVCYSMGRVATWWGILLYSPLMLAAFLGLYDRGKAKERFLAHFFHGMPYKEFKRMGHDFADVVETFVNTSMLQCLQQHQQQGDTVYVISASIEDWVRPWCERHHVEHVLATQIEVADGLLTGHFSSPNCSGNEKVKRFLAVEPQRETYHLTAYGDSNGDSQLLAFADEGTRI